MLEQSPLVREVIGHAIEVHRTLGPGLLESAYNHCLAHELRMAGRRFAIQVPLAIYYKGTSLDVGYRLDLVIEDALVVEIKSVERLLPIHTAQVLTYLKLSRIRQGLLLNFNSLLMKEGIKSLFDQTRLCEDPASSTSP